jgi:16S rRNA G966 N2-methylase RsmD
MNNKLYKLFPSLNNYSLLNYDEVGLYSITNYEEADKISEIIILLYNTNNINILDGTAGLGGNTFSFSKYFKNITAIELNNTRFRMLNNNIHLYNLKNINTINTNSIEYMFNNYDNYDIYFFDPPWGGHDYKEQKILNLKLDNKSLKEIIKIMISKTNDKLIIFKLPYNYDLNEFNLFNYKLYYISNYFIIIIII